MTNLHLLGKTPVNPHQPAGTDVKYDPDFETLQAEIDKLASPSATEGVNWRTVSDISAHILEEKSKDLLVAAYFAVSRIHVDKLDGVIVGVTVYRDLLETFWDTLFPVKKRMRGRINAVEWWIEKTETALGLIQGGTFKEETKQTILEGLAQIQTLLNGHLPEPVSIAPIERAIGRFKTVAPKPTPKPDLPKETMPKAVTPPPESVSSQSVLPRVIGDALPETGAMTSPGDALNTLEAGLKVMGNAARFYFGHDPKDPSSYRYARLSMWAVVEALPVITEDRKTIIPPPDPHLVTTLKDLLEKGDHANLLEVAEEKAPEDIFWLDLHYYVATALKGLGSDYDAARGAVGDETAYFIHRFPDLPLFQFADGTPFAGPETGAWIKRIRLGGSGAMPEPISVSSKGAGDDGADSMEKEIRRAAEMAGKKQLGQALALLQSHLRSSYSKREALLWRIAMVQLLIGAGKADIALPHLEQILCDIQDYRLEQYDPNLALNGLKTVLSGFRLHGEPPSVEKATEVLKRLARLDAVAALELVD